MNGTKDSNLRSISWCFNFDPHPTRTLTGHFAVREEGKPAPNAAGLDRDGEGENDEESEESSERSEGKEGAASGSGNAGPSARTCLAFDTQGRDWQQVPVSAWKAQEELHPLLYFRKDGAGFHVLGCPRPKYLIFPDVWTYLSYRCVYFRGPRDFFQRESRRFFRVPSSGSESEAGEATEGQPNGAGKEPQWLENDAATSCESSGQSVAKNSGEEGGSLWPSPQICHFGFFLEGLRFLALNMWLWLKKPVPKWNPGKWKHGPTPAVCPSCLILSHTHVRTL